MYNSTPFFVKRESWFPGLSAAERRRDAERELVAAVLADPASLTEIAVAEGVRPRHFRHRDYRLVFCACMAATGATLQTAEVLLRMARLWEDWVPDHYDGPLHSSGTLHALASSYAPSPVHVRRNARRLLHIADRLQRSNLL